MYPSTIKVRNILCTYNNAKDRVFSVVVEHALARKIQLALTSLSILGQIKGFPACPAGLHFMLPAHIQCVSLLNHLYASKSPFFKTVAITLYCCACPCPDIFCGTQQFTHFKNITILSQQALQYSSSIRWVGCYFPYTLIFALTGRFFLGGRGLYTFLFLLSQNPIVSFAGRDSDGSRLVSFILFPSNKDPTLHPAGLLGDQAGHTKAPCLSLASGTLLGNPNWQGG